MLKKNIKLFIYSLFAFLFIMPCVYAANQVEIKSVSLESKSENTKILTDASYEFLAIKFDIEFKKVNDYAEYKIIINNPTEKDYEINEEASKSKYISYEYRYDDDNNVAEANKETIMYIKIKYNLEAPLDEFVDGKVIETEKLIINIFSNIDGYGNVDESVINPSTMDNLTIWIILLLTSLILTIVLYKKTKNNKYLSIMLIGVLLLPASIYALEKIEISIDSKVTIKGKRPVSETIYWALQDNDTNGTNETLIIADHEITGNESGNFDGNTEFETFGEVPWINGGWNSNLALNVTNIDIDGIVVPKSTAHWFEYVAHNSSTLTAHLKNLDVSNVENMESMFSDMGEYASSVTVDGLEEWNTGSVTNMKYMFKYFGSGATTVNLTGLENWDTSNVTDMVNIFYYFGYYTNDFSLNLNNWDVSNVENFMYAFAYTGHESTIFNLGVSNWKPSSVTQMNGMFKQAGYNATSFELDLSNWDTSNLLDTQNLFYNAAYNSSSVNIKLDNWNTSKLETMTMMFCDTGYNATSWNVTIPKTNGNGLSNTTETIYGKDNAYSYHLESERSFTIAS